MIIINFKNYKSGKQALKLANTIEKFLPSSIICPSLQDLSKTSEKVKLKIFTQHVDFFAPGRATGFTIIEDTMRAGAQGSLLNHSEHRLTEQTIEKTIKRANSLGFKIILCVDSPRQAKKFKELKPWAMAYEDPELVSTKKSITQFRTNQLKKFVEILKRSRIIPLCGAGIHTKWDLIASRQLGCKGVLISSAIANTNHPEVFLKSLGKF